MTKSHLLFLVKILLALVVLGYVISVVDGRQLVEAARRAHLGWVLLALALWPVNVALEGKGWQLFLRQALPSMRWREAVAGLLAGHALGLMTPARLGELAGRAFTVPALDRKSVMAMVLVERLFTMLVALTFGLIPFIDFVYSNQPVPTVLWNLAGLAGLVVWLMLMGAVWWPRAIFAWVRRRMPAFLGTGQAFQFIQTLDASTIGRLLVPAALRYGVYVLQFACLVRAFSADVVLGEAYRGGMLVFYAKFLLPSVTLLDLGIREGVAVFFLGKMGLPEAAAFNAAFCLFLINLVLPALLGIPLVFRMHLARPSSS